MNREEQIARHNKNIDDAFEAARRGEQICLSALIGGAEDIHVSDIDGKEDRGDTCYSDNWRVKQD